MVPKEIVWGGRINSQDQFFTLEIVSISLNVFMLLIVLIYMGAIRWKLKPVILKSAFWIMFLLFLLNTVGNLFSENEFEKTVFTPLTLLLALLCLRIAIAGGRQPEYGAK